MEKAVSMQFFILSKRKRKIVNNVNTSNLLNMYDFLINTRVLYTDSPETSLFFYTFLLT